MSQPSIPDLAKFINSCLNAKQMGELIGLLDRTDPTALDPEAAAEKKPGAQKVVAPAGMQELLREIEAAYSPEKYPNPTAEESRRVRDAYPGFIERCSAYQGRHLVRMIRDRLSSI